MFGPTTRESLAALDPEGLVHWVDEHRNPNHDTVWALFCGGYTTRISHDHVPYVTCIACATGMDYWREE